MTRRSAPAALLALALAVPGVASAHELFDHAPPSRTGVAPPSPAFLAGGQGATWRLVGTIPTGNPHTDLDFFVKGGETYASVGTLAIGPNGGGQTIVKLTNGGRVAPGTISVVSQHPSAACPSNPGAALGLQHDVEATPKGGTLLNTFNPSAVQREAELLVDATDGRGRCHDQGSNLGVSGAPLGGLEFVDISDPAKPKEIGLTTHIGQAHTVNVDPKRPHIAYSVTSDGIGVTDQKRANETATSDTGTLDGWEVVDFSTCMNFPEGTSVVQKRERCRPQVYRYRYPTLEMAQGFANKGTVYGCHELEVYPDDKLTCASGQALMVFDMAGAFDDRGTPTDPTDDKPRGTPLPCTVRKSTSAASFQTGAMVTDCVDGPAEGATDLYVSGWLKQGAPSLEGVKHLGSVFHQGRNSTQQSAQPRFNSLQDIDFDHEAEFTTSRRFLFASDERGGGVVPPGASCPTSPGDNPIGNGGLHFYRPEALRATTPGTADEAFAAYAKTSSGQKAIYRTPIRTKPQGSLCTAHVFQQIPGQNRIFMGWYSQGTQVVDFRENPDGTIDFTNAGYFIPANANQWVSHIFKAQRNPDGTFTYWGATGDFALGDAGRSAIDVYEVTLPAPPVPAGGTGTQGEPAPAPPGSPLPVTAGRCTSTAGFRTVAAQGVGRSLRLSFDRLVRKPVRIEVFRQSRGRRITGELRVARFPNRTSAVRWRARGVRDGVYIARFTMRPGGRPDVRRLAVERRGGRWRVLEDYYFRGACGILSAAKLERPVFGGATGRSLLASFLVRRAAAVTVVVRDSRGKLVRRFAERTYQPGRSARLSVGARGVRKGRLVRVEIIARRGGTQSTVTLAARRL